MSIQNNELPQNPNIESETVRPFRRFCTTIMTIGSLPSSYQEAMSYQEMLLWLCDFIENKVIPAFDNNANAITELQNLYVELKNYCDNYFTNLDVQEEINKKLDEMAENGTLLQILSNSFIVFNNVEEMLNSNRLNNGMVAYTLGYYNKNDGGNAKYIITNISEDLTQGFLKFNNKELYAKLILDNINVKKLGVKTDVVDTLNIQNAIDFCYNNKIDCIFPKGNYLIDNTINLHSQHKVILDNNTTISSNANIDMINMPWGSMLEGGLIQNNNSSFNLSIILLNSSNYLVDNKNGYIKNITLIGSTQNCNGIRTKYSANNNGISYFTIDDVFIKGCGYALKITDDENANSNSYFTANLINNLRTFVCKNNIYINLPKECGGNNFKNIQIQPPANYNSALFLNSSAYNSAQYNIFEMMVWDTPTGLVPFQLGNNTSNNIIYSYDYNTLINEEEPETRINDEGKNNQFITGTNIKHFINSLDKFTELDLSSLSKQIVYPVIFENLINCVIDLNNISGQSFHLKMNVVPAQDGYRSPYYDVIMSSYYNNTKRNLVKIENKTNSKYTVLYLVGGYKYNLINYNVGYNIKNNFININPQIITENFVDGSNLYQPMELGSLKSIKNGHYMGFTNINLDENSAPLSLT